MPHVNVTVINVYQDSYRWRGYHGRFLVSRLFDTKRSNGDSTAMANFFLCILQLFKRQLVQRESCSHLIDKILFNKSSVETGFDRIRSKSLKNFFTSLITMQIGGGNFKLDSFAHFYFH